MPRLTVQEFNSDFITQVPLAMHMNIQALELGKGTAKLLMPYGPHLTRPVDTISGPALMTLSDLALWAAILTYAGRQEMTVTTNLNINFMRMPGNSNIIAEAKVMKMGRSLAVADVDLLSEANGALIAHATATYALPR